MAEANPQINFDSEDHILVGDYPDPAINAAIENLGAKRKVGEVAFQQVIDQESLNGKYNQQIRGVNEYFSARGLAFDPVRIVTSGTMSKAYDAAGEHPTEDVESALGRNIHGRSVVVENAEIQELFGDDYLLGLGLHEAAHSLSLRRVITTTREVIRSNDDGLSGMSIVTGGIGPGGLVKADLRRNTPSKLVGDFWEEAFADLTRVRGLRYLQLSHDIAGGAKDAQMGEVSVKVVPNGIDRSQMKADQTTSVIPAEFASVAKVSEGGRNMVGVSPANFAAYALELLDSRVPGLYEDMEAGTRDSSRQAEAIRKIESVRPGLYRQLRELEYSELDFTEGLRVIEAELSLELSTK